jgi:hypothetical protein
VRHPLFQSVRPVNKSCCVITLQRQRAAQQADHRQLSHSRPEQAAHVRYNFFYNVMKAVFPRDHLRLLMTDTDSLVMEVLLRPKQTDMLDVSHVIARYDDIDEVRAAAAACASSTQQLFA